VGSEDELSGAGDEAEDAAALETALARVVAGLPGGGEERPGQLAMAHAVRRSFESGRHLVVRAGTGTGKSLAYLVPALLSGKRVVVATATKALQDQLGSKDLPEIERLLGRRVRFAVLKGRSNYLCRQRIAEGAARDSQQSLLETPTERRRAGSASQEARKIAEWAASTESGDVAELGFEPDNRVWSSFSVTPGECPGAHRCPSGADCFAELARARAGLAEVVVVNLHLLGAHLASGDVVLPEHDALVVDEAHDLEEVMSRSLGASIGPGQLRGLVAAARAAGVTDEAADAVIDSAAQFEGFLAAREGTRLGPGRVPELDEFVNLVASRLERVERQLRDLVAGRDGDDAAAATNRLTLQVGRLREQLVDVLEPGERVVWVERGQRPTLEVAPLDVGEILGPQLFEMRPVVLTSATVSDGLAVRLGAAARKVEVLDVGSPFAFKEHALLYCAAHLPDPRSPGAEAAVHDELGELIVAAGGRTLALFTSRRAMLRASEVLRTRLSEPILLQGEGSKAELLRQFSDEEETSLFATMSFWQGVDVPGPTLSLVAIDRLPFSPPDDPLLVARRERAGANAFAAVDLPRAASLLAQGAGRLIRSATDRGVVAVLDPRLALASYRAQLLASLPPMRRSKDPAEARAFLSSINERSAPTH
jgi:ATP-dependent DNA helicase DinG